TPRVLPIARDNVSSLQTAFSLIDDADLVVTIGGASVGDHDLVGEVAQSLGMEQAFYKVAMRPGKPLMAGRIGNAAMIGLPGNPVSSLVCGHVFLAPMVEAMQGLPAAALPRLTAPLGADIGPNGPREHYMRATLKDGKLYPQERQDSSLLSVLACSNALYVRPPKDEAQRAGTAVPYIPI
ncbi:MAG: molybdopterin-binding protein, partial [Pseudomonadota bacterium]